MKRNLNARALPATGEIFPAARRKTVQSMVFTVGNYFAPAYHYCGISRRAPEKSEKLRRAIERAKDAGASARQLWPRF